MMMVPPLTRATMLACRHLLSQVLKGKASSLTCVALWFSQAWCDLSTGASCSTVARCITPSVAVSCSRLLLLLESFVNADMRLTVPERGGVCALTGVGAGAAGRSIHTYIHTYIHGAGRSTASDSASSKPTGHGAFSRCPTPSMAFFITWLSASRSSLPRLSPPCSLACLHQSACRGWERGCSSVGRGVARVWGEGLLE